MDINTCYSNQMGRNCNHYKRRHSKQCFPGTSLISRVLQSTLGMHGGLQINLLNCLGRESCFCVWYCWKALLNVGPPGELSRRGYISPAALQGAGRVKCQVYLKESNAVFIWTLWCSYKQPRRAEVLLKSNPLPHSTVDQVDSDIKREWFWKQEHEMLAYT